MWCIILGSLGSIPTSLQRSLQQLGIFYANLIPKLQNSTLLVMNPSHILHHFVPILIFWIKYRIILSPTFWAHANFQLKSKKSFKLNFLDISIKQLLNLLVVKFYTRGSFFQMIISDRPICQKGRFSDIRSLTLCHSFP